MQPGGRSVWEMSEEMWSLTPSGMAGFGGELSLTHAHGHGLHGQTVTADGGKAGFSLCSYTDSFRLLTNGVLFCELCVINGSV